MNVYESILRDKEVKLIRVGEIRVKETKEKFIGSIRSGKVWNDKLIISDRVAPKIFFVDIASGKIVKSIGRLGKGPGEMLEVIDFDVSDSGIFVYDQISRRISRFDVNSGEFLYSFPAPPSNLIPTGGNIKVIGDKIYFGVIEAKYAKERYKSRSIAVFDFRGNLLNLFGVWDEIAKTFKYGGFMPFDYDRFGNVYSGDWKSYRVYKYDRSYGLVKAFGYQGIFRMPVEDIDPFLPFPDISKKLMKSSATMSIIVSDDYVYHHFYDLTEEGTKVRSYLKNRNYLRVYDLDGNYIPSDIEIPGVLLDVDDGKIYIHESDEPENKVIGVYRFKIVDKGK